MPLRALLTSVALALASAALAAPAQAIPIFAHQYGVSCRKCHTVIPHLTEFGAAFLAAGERIPGVQPGDAVPFAVKVNLVDSSQNQGSGPNGAGLPKAIVDEVELFTAGAIGNRGSFYVEQYAIDGGDRGNLRDAWVADHVTPWGARIPVDVAAGQFTLPLPVDPETFRETYQHYTIYDQTVGFNPFNLFDPKDGLRVSVGDALRGLNVQLFAGPGHDQTSSLPPDGIDVMEYVQDSMGPFALSAYHYTGARPAPNMLSDQFQRTGFALTFNNWGRWTSESLLQTGWDSNCGGGQIPFGCESSGGFTQLRYAFSKRFFALGRYEGTNQPGAFARDGVLLLGYGTSVNSRLTVEDVVAHTPQTTNTMNAQLTIAY